MSAGILVALLLAATGQATGRGPPTNSGRSATFTATDPTGLSSFAGPVYLSTTATVLGPLKGKDILGCADVRAFGATGNGATNDTAAIQAAINSFPSPGGPVCLPRGTYKITSTLNLQKSTHLYGAGMSSMDSIGVSSTATVIDATGIPQTQYTYAIKGPGNAANMVLRDFRLNGPASLNTIGLSPGVSATHVHLQNVYVDGFGWGIYFSSVAKFNVVGVRTENAENVGLYLTNGSALGTVVGSLIANTVGHGTAPANIKIDGNSNEIEFLSPLTDEIFNQAGNGSASILVLGARRIHFFGHRVYYSKINGYGIRLGDGITNPTECTLTNVRVERFGGSDVGPTSRVEVHGSGHSLINVSTDSADGGSTVIDDSTGTTWWNVNGLFKTPTLPTSYPGTGSKQLWYDPTAACTTCVRFAP